MAEMLQNYPRLLGEAMVGGLRTALDMSEDACYLAAFPAWIEGSPHDRIVQVCPGDARPWGDGDGGQEGGNIFREQNYTVALFFAFNIDPHGMTEEAMTELANGILDYAEKVRVLLTGAEFPDANGDNQQQADAMRYRGESGVQVVDGDFVLMLKTLTFAVAYASPLYDTALTLGRSST